MPNENEERMRWIELMPLIMQNIQMVQSLRDVGIPDQFNPYIQLLEETFKRFDERIDVSQFMPPVPEQIQAQVLQNQVMQQLMMGDKGGQGGQNGAQPAMPGAQPGIPGAQPGMPSEFTQQLNEVKNAPGNRVNQRERNQYRPPS
jgi:hypothetical protein